MKIKIRPEDDISEALPDEADMGEVIERSDDDKP